MMEIQVQLILIACIGNFVFTSVQSFNQIVDQASIAGKAHVESEVRKNFQNLFNSIARNDEKKSEIYHDFLKQEVAREQQTFGAIKEELQISRMKNVYKNRDSYKKMNVRENVTAIKRETNEDNRVRLSLEHDVYSITTKRTYNFTAMNNTNDTSWEDVQKYPKEKFDIIYTKILNELSLNDTSKKLILTNSPNATSTPVEAQSCLKEAYSTFIDNCYFAYVVGGMQKYKQLFLRACTAEWLDSKKINELVVYVCKDYRIGFIDHTELNTWK